MRCEVTGFYVAAYYPAEKGDPVHGYAGDKFKCPNCGEEVVIFDHGCSGGPITTYNLVLEE